MSTIQHSAEWTMLRFPTARLLLALACPLLIGRAAEAQFVPADQPDRTLAPAERGELIAALIKALNDKYVFPDVATRMASKLTERQNSGAYGTTSAKELSKLLSADLYEIAHDKHLNVFYSANPLPPPGAGGGPPPRAVMAAMNYGFSKVERMKGNVGYLKFDGFMDPEGGAGDVAAGAMAFLSGTDALIIDLRENHGGSPAMVAFLCSYLFDGRPIHLNSLYWRASNQTQQFWTLPFVPGSRYVNKEVYLLTSKETFSAAEEFTYNLKTQKRATIVGDTTGGGANPGGVERLTEHFAAFVPGGRAINPITGTNWEGTGVSPDLPTPADKALEVAYRTALTKLSGASRGPMLDRETKMALERPTP